jgi:hypothetical protein
MKDFGKIVGYNLLAILIYSALIRLIVGGDSMGIAILSAFVVGAHFLITIIVGIAKSGKSNGRAWLLAALVVALVGFSTCLGNASFGTSSAFH